MKALVIGSGGREHALCWKLAAEGWNVFCAPGNPGIAEVAEVRGINPNDRMELLTWAKHISADLVVVGPEAPLISGIADMLRENGFNVFGPSMNAAKLEGSKGFSKDMMKRAGVPTPRYQTFSDPIAAVDFAKELCEAGQGVVVKASGPALGKGVYVCESLPLAESAVKGMLNHNTHGEAGRSIVVEEMLEGREISLLTMVSGRSLLTLPVVQDYKRIGEGDTGPNTGGMGSYSPVSWVSDAMVARAEEEIVLPILDTLRDIDVEYQGMLFAGIMEVEGNPYCLEYNVRFGDPETQSVVMRLGNGLGEAMMICAQGGDLKAIPVLDNAVCSVTVASAGYPGEVQVGQRIELGEIPPGGHVFHAGTANSGGGLISSGGRVMTAVGVGESLSEAVSIAYRTVDAIRFEGMQYRRDIAGSR